MSTNTNYPHTGTGTVRDSYSLQKEDLDELRRSGVRIDTPKVPVRHIEANYKHELGDNYSSMSLTAKTYFGISMEIGSYSGEDIDDWQEVRRTLQQLDRS